MSFPTTIEMASSRGSSIPRSGSSGCFRRSAWRRSCGAFRRTRFFALSWRLPERGTARIFPVADQRPAAQSENQATNPGFRVHFREANASKASRISGNPLEARAQSRRPGKKGAGCRKEADFPSAQTAWLRGGNGLLKGRQDCVNRTPLSTLRLEESGGDSLSPSTFHWTLIALNTAISLFVFHSGASASFTPPFALLHTPGDASEN